VAIANVMGAGSGRAKDLVSEVKVLVTLAIQPVVDQRAAVPQGRIPAVSKLPDQRHRSASLFCVGHAEALAWHDNGIPDSTGQQREGPLLTNRWNRALRVGSRAAPKDHWHVAQPGEALLNKGDMQAQEEGRTCALTGCG
jgi:hypothetical protein